MRINSFSVPPDRLRWILPLTVAILTTGSAWGQSSRNIGGTISGGNRTAFGGGSSGGASGANGGTGVQGTAGSRINQIASAGQITGSERYVRDNRTAGQFVGSDQSDSS